MDLSQFDANRTGQLVDIAGTDNTGQHWTHQAFVPHPLPSDSPELTGQTYRAVADARAAVAALDNTARRLPNPTLLRQPTLRREAQSTSALEGTYAPLEQVLTADEGSPSSAELREIINYVQMASEGIAWVSDGRPVTTGMLANLQGILRRGTHLVEVSGRLREVPVVIGQRAEVAPTAPAVERSRFVPAPPGDQLEVGVDSLVNWMNTDHSADIDPIVAVAMTHYQFETLHPFRDGNGRLGRFLIMVHLMLAGELSEPTLSVSPWFEERRARYYDSLLGVSTTGDWDSFVQFFARGITESARATLSQMLALTEVREELRQAVRASPLRAESAMALVDHAVAHPSFTVESAVHALDLTSGRARKLIYQFMELGLLRDVDPSAYRRRYFAPRVLDVLLGRG